MITHPITIYDDGDENATPSSIISRAIGKSAAKLSALRKRKHSVDQSSSPLKSQKLSFDAQLNTDVIFLSPSVPDKQSTHATTII